MLGTRRWIIDQITIRYLTTQLRVLDATPEPFVYPLVGPLQRSGMDGTGSAQLYFNPPELIYGSSPGFTPNPLPSLERLAQPLMSLASAK
jgi:hypothetical protein